MQISITDGIIKQTLTNVLLVGETKNDELYYSRNGRVPGSCKKQKWNSYAMNAVGLVVKIEKLVMKQLVGKIWEKIVRIMSV